jgi:hypothetical protein
MSIRWWYCSRFLSSGSRFPALNIDPSFLKMEGGNRVQLLSYRGWKYPAERAESGLSDDMIFSFRIPTSQEGNKETTFLYQEQDLAALGENVISVICVDHSPVASRATERFSMRQPIKAIDGVTKYQGGMRRGTSLDCGQLGTSFVFLSFQKGLVCRNGLLMPG